MRIAPRCGSPQISRDLGCSCDQRQFAECLKPPLVFLVSGDAPSEQELMILIFLLQADATTLGVTGFKADLSEELERVL